jgi:site-specific DNA-methyltransferase (adenine-specific)
VVRVLIGDSRKLLSEMEPNSVDAIVCDPPYEINFMGSKDRNWDRSGISYDPTFWAECLRVLKPGGHMTAFGACRTYHRIACAIEDAGFEIRDSLHWLFGSGFPKSLDISKAIDKAAGAEREAGGVKVYAGGHVQNSGESIGYGGCNPAADSRAVTAPATPEAQQWDGWGSATKPAHEPVVLARKPLAGTIAETVLEYGTGGLNVDGCRVATDDGKNRGRPPRTPNAILDGGNGTNLTASEHNDAGRWPPNVMLSPETAAKLGDKASYFPVFDYGDEDRFFYAPKASREEREAGCEHLKKSERGEFCLQSHEGQKRVHAPVGNHHPTVKPVSLMRWLCRLITPPGGLVLDPFAGSGTTGIAAVSEGFDFVGIELDPDHHAIAMARIEHAASVAPETNRAEYVPPKKKQLGLF